MYTMVKVVDAHGDTHYLSTAHVVRWHTSQDEIPITSIVMSDSRIISVPDTADGANTAHLRACFYETTERDVQMDADRARLAALIDNGPGRFVVGASIDDPKGPAGREGPLGAVVRPEGPGEFERTEAPSSMPGTEAPLSAPRRVRYPRPGAGAGELPYPKGGNWD